MSDQSYSLSASSGTLSGATLTTPAAGGDVTVTASGGGTTGATVVHAIKTPSSITVKTGSTAITSLTAVPGSTVSLTASAVYNHLALKADAAAFTWTVSGNIGTVDSTGKFTASQPGTGSITVAAGGKSVTVAVTVSKVALSTVENFESGVGTFTNDGEGIVPSACSNPEYVRFGTGSLKLDYSGLDVSANAATPASYSVTTPYTLLNFWVYGDGSGNTLSVLTSDGSTATSVSVGTLDFIGWKQLSVALPSGVSSITGLSVTGRTVTTADPLTGDVTITYPHGLRHLCPNRLLCPGGGDVVVTVGDPGHHPQHIAVYRRLPEREGRRRDGPGGVLPDAGQRQQRGIIRRKSAAVPLRHELRGLLQVPCPAVIAQPFPALQQQLLRRGGQRLHCGEVLQKPGVIVQHRRHPGLLEHVR